MGESREGGRGMHEVQPSDYIGITVASYIEEDREPAWVMLKRVSEGLWSIEIQIHGESEPEEILYFSSEDLGLNRVPPPNGGDRPESRQG